MIKISRALLSVSDKSNILELATILQDLNIEIISTGGTADLLKENNIKVTEVSEYTQFPEMLDGRVKTLHPKIYGGILAQRDNPKHIDTLKKQSIPQIDLVIVNLYPFESTINNPKCNLELAIENIDIGGPTMVRAAAKNYKSVAILTNPNEYDNFSQQLIENNGALGEAYRFKLAQNAFSHTAHYDKVISEYLSKNDKEENFPNTLTQNMNKKMDMRYGENPHQAAAFYVEPKIQNGSLANFNQIQGKELSFNNLNDSDTAWECVKLFSDPTCVIVKHANPCGICTAITIKDAYTGAFSTDPTSAFGGIISINKEMDSETAELIMHQFVEVIIAPSYSEAALNIFKTKVNIRLLQVDIDTLKNNLDFKKIGGGWLVQTTDDHKLDINKCKVVTKLKPSAEQLEDLNFAWEVARHVKSNAIIFCKDKKTLGVGAGQMSRVDSTRIAAIKAENANISLTGSVVASDAFFPFRDGIDVLSSYGAKCVIQPGGSIKDDEVIKAADEHGLIMIFTGIRHFKH
jgi:phosphoribosylaminoimidazolecarboxamide formyltransferase/IMP cyclohydrolase